MYQIIQKRKYTYVFSVLLLIASIGVLSMWGLNLGIDFKGGTLMEVRFSEEISKESVEASLEEIELKSLTVQPTDNNGILVRYLASDEAANEKVLKKLQDLDESAQQVRVDFIGASVSDQITKKAVQAVVVAVMVIALYIAWAFRKVSKPVPSWQYGIGAIIALFHDVIITLGVFSVLGKFFEVEVGVPFIAALLTILGYSVNDTIVVYDRTRENIIRYGRKEKFEQIVNRSLNETLARSINTSLTVVFVLVAIILFGGETVKYFSVALLIGVIAGTYSSIYVASASLVTSYKYHLKKKEAK